MKVKSQEIVWIEMEKLIAHPKNANVMSAENLRKLRRHVERSGRYEPLVVRRHPAREGCFELINGHHRKRVLQEIGETEAACVVWELSDAETLLLLATVNRLAGEDAAGRRVDLIEALSNEMEIAAKELAHWLPEDEATLRGILERDLARGIATPADPQEMDEPFTVFLKSAEKKQLVAALKKTDRDAAKALMKWTDKMSNAE